MSRTNIPALPPYEPSSAYPAQSASEITFTSLAPAQSEQIAATSPNRPTSASP